GGAVRLWVRDMSGCAELLAEVGERLPHGTPALEISIGGQHRGAAPRWSGTSRESSAHHTGCSTTGLPLRRVSKGEAMRIEGRTALVTGATGGIGHAIARALRGRGAKLVLTGRKTDVLGRLARELEAQVFAVDLADRHSLEHLIERTESVDILVANAALPASGRIGALTDADIDAAIKVNLRAPIVL